MKNRTLLIAAIAAFMVSSASIAQKPDPVQAQAQSAPQCSTDANGKKYCCVATGMGGYCYYP